MTAMDQIALGLDSLAQGLIVVVKQRPYFNY